MQKSTAVYISTVSALAQDTVVRRIVQLANNTATPAAFRLHSYLIKFISASGENLVGVYNVFTET